MTGFNLSEMLRVVWSTENENDRMWRDQKEKALRMVGGERDLMRNENSFPGFISPPSKE